MSRKSPLKVADRQSRPYPDRFLTFMVVLTKHTFKITIRRKFVFWAIGIAAGLWAVAFIGSWYGFWATKKIMSFSDLEKETREQQQQLRESMEQADLLKQEIGDLYDIVDGLIKEINPRAATQSPQDSGEADNGKASNSSVKIDSLKNELDQADDRLKALQARMSPIIEQWNHTPSVWPTSGVVTSPYGMRIHPFSRATGGDDSLFSQHSGLDISNAHGTPIRATANGKVTHVGWDGNYGLQVTIRHSQEFETVYAHLHRSYVRIGQEVERNHIIGSMGQTGRATGPHLHYEVRRNGHHVNPKPFLRLQRQWLTGLR